MALGERTVHADTVINDSRIGGFQILVLFLGGLVLFTDGFNTHDLNYVAFAVRDELALSQSALGAVSAAGTLGLLAGYLLLSPLGGYFGPKRMTLFSVAMYGAMAILTSFAQDITQLVILRFLTGMALASAIPAMVAIISEFAPLRRRSSFITFSYFGLSLGQLSAGVVSDILLADYGWRSVILTGGLIALVIVPVLLALLPESIEYLVNRGRQPEKAAQTLRRAVPQAGVTERTTVLAGRAGDQRVAVTELFQDGRAMGTILIWLAIMMNLIPNQFFGSWLTTIMVDSGFTEQQAIHVKMANDGAGMIVAFIIGPLMDRYGPYRVMAATFMIGSVVVAATGITLTGGIFLPIITMCFVVGLCNSGISKGSNAVGAHFYPTALRSAGVGWGLGIGRIAAFGTPILAGLLLDLGWDAATLFYLVAAPLIIGALAHLVLQKLYGEKPPSQPRADITPVEGRAIPVAR